MSLTPIPLLLVVGVATGLATLLGGAMALRFQSGLNRLLGFSSGAIIGVALFGLLPQALDLAGEQHSHLTITTAMAIGFGLYHAADRIAAVLSRGVTHHRSHFAPASLTTHSLMDGVGIGLAFHASAATGLIVAFAVLAHDLVDGANTVILSLAGGTGVPNARRWLLADAVAPLIGIALARLISVPPFILALLLGLFAGVFLYIGASQLLSRSNDDPPRLSAIATTAAGIALIYSVIRLAGG